MIHKEELRCPYCTNNELVKNGKSANGTQRWLCNSCKKGFRFDYRYNARKSGTREKIIEMTLNSSGVRDIGRVLRISKDTVCSVLKKNFKNESILLDRAGK
jgi:transposase-like protein